MANYHDTPRAPSLGGGANHQQIHAALTGLRSTAPRRTAAASSEKLLLTAAESAVLCGMSLRKFHQTRDDLPKPVVLGKRHVRWRRADLVAWVDGLAVVDERQEPAQLRAGKAAKKGTPGAPLVDSQAPSAEPQAGRGIGLLVAPSSAKA